MKNELLILKKYLNIKENCLEEKDKQICVDVKKDFAPDFQVCPFQYICKSCPPSFTPTCVGCRKLSGKIHITL